MLCNCGITDTWYFPPSGDDASIDGVFINHGYNPLSRTALRVIKNTIWDDFRQQDVVLPVSFTSNHNLELCDDNRAIGLQQLEGDIFEVLTQCFILLPRQRQTLWCNTMI